MKYLLLLFDTDEDWEPTPEVMAPWGAFDQEAARVATIVASDALGPSRHAKVVSVRKGKTVVTDGPYIETKEQVVGYYLLECESLDVALSLAAKVPLADAGYVEVRPVVDLES